ncbi:MAG: YgjV family protein [Blautia sp.]|nr:YgjV family protein [Blautia sp.]
MNRILIGNAISFVAAIALLMGCIVESPKKVYLLQVVENAVLCLSSIVFGSWTGLSTLSLSIIRSVLLMKNKYDKKWMVILSALIVVFGAYLNEMGLIGWLPILATVQWSVCSYYARKIIPIKIGMLVNILMWMVYFFAIWDFSSGIAQIITAGICTVSIIKLTIQKKKGSNAENYPAEDG